MNTYSERLLFLSFFIEYFRLLRQHPVPSSVSLLPFLYRHWWKCPRKDIAEGRKLMQGGKRKQKHRRGRGYDEREKQHWEEKGFIRGKRRNVEKEVALNTYIIKGVYARRWARMREKEIT